MGVVHILRNTVSRKNAQNRAINCICPITRKHRMYPVMQVNTM